MKALAQRPNRPNPSTYKDWLPYIIASAQCRNELFDSFDIQAKFVSLLEGCRSAVELKGILSFPVAERFVVGTNITWAKE